MYRSTTNGVIRLSDGAFIPTDQNNYHYQKYLADIAADPNCVSNDITSASLAEMKASAKAEIDKEAEVTRMRYITSGDGQAMTYISKALEAEKYIAAGYPVDLTDYPYIESDSSALDITAAEAADAIIAIRDAWISISAQIEYTRLFGKRSVDGAPDEISVVSEMNYAITALRAI